MKKLLLVALTVTGMLGVSARQADAALIFTMQPVGGDVMISGGGTLDLTGLTFFTINTTEIELFPSRYFEVGAEPAQIDQYGVAVTGPTSLGPGPSFTAGTGSGDYFGFEFLTPTGLGVPQGYVSNSLLSGTATFTGATLASLGVTPGVYVWTLRNEDTITLTIDATPAPEPAPEPATVLLLGTGLLGAAVRRRRNSRK